MISIRRPALARMACASQLCILLVLFPACGVARARSFTIDGEAVDAEVVGVENDIAQLRRADGIIISIGIPKLAQADRQFVVDWLNAADFAVRKEHRLIREAHRLMEIGADQEARKSFEAASKVRPESIRADFYLGILNALKARSPQDAEKHFRRCLTRLRQDPEQLIGGRLGNLVAVLNNLAITEVRQRDLDKAMNDCELALAIAPQTPELFQNLGLLSGMLSKFPQSSSTGAAKKASKLFGVAGIANPSTEYDSSRGWLYMSLIDEQDSLHLNPNNDELRPVGYATCFAVNNDHFITTTRAIADVDLALAQLNRTTPGP